MIFRVSPVPLPESVNALHVHLPNPTFHCRVSQNNARLSAVEGSLTGKHENTAWEQRPPPVTRPGEFGLVIPSVQVARNGFLGPL